MYTTLNMDKMFIYIALVLFINVVIRKCVMYLKNILNHGKGIAKRGGGELGLKYHDPLPHLESKYTQTKSRFSISKFLEGKRDGGGGDL